MKAILMTAALAALAACSERTAENAAAATGNMAGDASAAAEDGAAAGVGMASATVADTADAYATNAALGDMYEIESSKLAAEKAQSPDVKRFASQMIADHTATTVKLKAAIADAKLNLQPPAALDARRQGMIDNLRGATGADFDRMYLDQQTAAHQEAVTLHGGYAKEGDNAALKKLAAETTPVIQHHLDMVKQLDKAGADGTK